MRYVRPATSGTVSSHLKQQPAASDEGYPTSGAGEVLRCIWQIGPGCMAGVGCRRRGIAMAQSAQATAAAAKRTKNAVFYWLMVSPVGPYTALGPGQTALGPVYGSSAAPAAPAAMTMMESPAGLVPASWMRYRGRQGIRQQPRTKPNQRPS